MNFHCVLISPCIVIIQCYHYEVIKWKHFPRYWPFVRGIHRSPLNSPHKGQWRGALIFSLICVWIHGWVNNREAGDLRCHRAHYDVSVMYSSASLYISEPLDSFVVCHTMISHRKEKHRSSVNMIYCCLFREDKFIPLGSNRNRTYFIRSLYVQRPSKTSIMYRLRITFDADVTGYNVNWIHAPTMYVQIRRLLNQGFYTI